MLRHQQGNLFSKPGCRGLTQHCTGITDNNCGHAGFSIHSLINGLAFARGMQIINELNVFEYRTVKTPSTFHLLSAECLAILASFWGVGPL